ncbi:hypothetical protein Plhal304r1_c056g0141841 [Plasmopara halstedii]
MQHDYVLVGSADLRSQRLLLTVNGIAHMILIICAVIPFKLLFVNSKAPFKKSVFASICCSIDPNLAAMLNTI